MSKWLGMITATLLASLAMAEEQLPDRAPVEERDDAAMADRFPAPLLDAEEMESLYLQSPALAENPEEQGMNALSDKDRYHESDMLFQEQLRKSQDNIVIQAPDQPVEQTPPPPVLTNPVRQL